LELLWALCVGVFSVKSMKDQELAKRKNLKLSKMFYPCTSLSKKVLCKVKVMTGAPIKKEKIIKRKKKIILTMKTTLINMCTLTKIQTQKAN
jgi:hypothetical protein